MTTCRELLLLPLPCGLSYAFQFQTVLDLSRAEAFVAQLRRELITGHDRGTIGTCGANRDYRMSTYDKAVLRHVEI
jgi:hypothetical protein